MEEISDVIRQIKDHGLTQEQIALRSGLTQPYISQLATGERGGRVTVSTYEALRSLLAELNGDKKQSRRVSSHA